MSGPGTSLSPRQFFRNLSLRTKIVSVITATSLIVVVLAMLASFFIELRFFRERLEKEHRTAARLVSENLEVSFAFAMLADSSEAQETLASLANLPAVRKAVALTTRGERLAEYRRKGVGELPELTLLTSEQFNWHHLIVSEPVEVEGAVLGRVIILVGLDELYSFLWARASMFGLLFCVVLGVAVLLAAKSGSLVSQPILDLAETAQRISRDQDYSRRHTRVYNDETGRLVDAFNVMMAEIETRQDVIQDNAERFRRYFELGVVGMGILDASMRWQEMNERMSEILGYGAKSLKAKTWTDSLLEEPGQQHRSELVQVLTGQRDRFSGECWMRGNHDRRVFAMVSLRRVEATRSQPLHFIVLVQDITARKEDEENLVRAKEEAEASNRAKDEFLSIMSHELRTPLNPIIGFGELLQEELTAKEHRSHLDVMMRSAQHLLELIDNILDYVRIERRAVDVPEEGIDFRNCVDEAIDILGGKANSSNLSLTVTHHSPTGWSKEDDVEHLRVFLPPTSLRQLVINLVSNALKFTVEGGVEVRTSVRREADSRLLLRVEVSDTGVGIAEADRDRIFEAFSQLDESLTRSHGGIGLGLAICRKLVEALDGRIGLQSKVGEGSTFWFELPASFAFAPAVVERPVPAVAQELDADVLLVEDDVNNRVVAEAVLRRCGVRVECAENGAEAVERMRSGEFQLVLMDVQMPEMNGFEATRRIRDLETEGELARVPIVGVSAHVGDQTVLECRTAGMDDFLSKPFKASELERMVRKWLGAIHSG